jgi:hypothetical protein
VAGRFENEAGYTGGHVAEDVAGICGTRHDLGSGRDNDAKRRKLTGPLNCRIEIEDRRVESVPTEPRSGIGEADCPTTMRRTTSWTMLATPLRKMQFPATRIFRDIRTRGPLDWAKLSVSGLMTTRSASARASKRGRRRGGVSIASVDDAGVA